MVHDKMRSGAYMRRASPLVSFNHVIDPHFVTFSSSLYTTFRNPNHNPNPNSNANTNPIEDGAPTKQALLNLLGTVGSQSIRGGG